MPAARPLRTPFLQHFLECEYALRRFVASVVPRPADRDDLVQEIVLRLWQLYARYDPARPFTPWALGVAARRMKEEARRSARRPSLPGTAQIEQMAEAFTALTESESGDAHAALTLCLEILPPESARLVKARYFDSTPGEAIAASTGQTVKAVYQALYRIRRQLADCVSRRLKTSDPHSHVHRS